jgi:hypothetical protein
MIKDEFGNRRFFGIYRGIVVDTKDPLDRNRIRLEVPQVLLSETTGWAWALLQDSVTPSVGQGVWVQFEGGDPSFPVWISTFGDPVQ